MMYAMDMMCCKSCRCRCKSLCQEMMWLEESLHFCPENNVRLHDDFVFFSPSPWFKAACHARGSLSEYATNTFLSLFRGLTESWGTGPSSGIASQRKAGVMCPAFAAYESTLFRKTYSL